MFDGIVTWWNALEPGVRPALVSACATILAATIGALVVARQIRTQSANAIRQNKHNEALKLKMKVYDEIINVCAKCQDADSSLTNFIRSVFNDVSISQKQQLAGRPFRITEHRFPHYLELQKSLDSSAVEMVFLTERWQIIDPRIEVFRTAFNVAMHDIRETSWRYWNTLMPLLPVDRRDAPGQQFNWEPPNEKQLETLEKFGSSFIKAIDLLGSFTYDFQIEMQNLLVGDLFGKTVPARIPIDPQYPVVTLNNHATLETYFAKNTSWGQNKTLVESDVRRSLMAKTRDGDLQRHVSPIKPPHL